MRVVTAICVCRKEVPESEIQKHLGECPAAIERFGRIGRQIMHKFCEPGCCGFDRQDDCRVAKDTIVEDIEIGEGWAPVVAIGNDGIEIRKGADVSSFDAAVSGA